MIERILIILFVLIAFIFADVIILEKDDYKSTSFNTDLSKFFNLPTS